VTSKILELSLGSCIGVHSRAASHQPYSKRRALLADARLSRMLLSEHLTGRANGIKRIGLGSRAAGWAMGTINFQHLFALLS
jgi:hypothetical protein